MFFLTLINAAFASSSDAARSVAFEAADAMIEARSDALESLEMESEIGAELLHTLQLFDAAVALCDPVQILKISKEAQAAAERLKLAEEHSLLDAFYIDADSLTREALYISRVPGNASGRVKWLAAQSDFSAAVAKLRDAREAVVLARRSYFKAENDSAVALGGLAVAIRSAASHPGRLERLSLARKKEEYRSISFDRIGALKEFIEIKKFQFQAAEKLMHATLRLVAASLRL